MKKDKIFKYLIFNKICCYISIYYYMANIMLNHMQNNQFDAKNCAQLLHQDKTPCQCQAENYNLSGKKSRKCAP